ncbi:hypothetical protein D8674_029335 [Pyrus ussuriensis x Pyrus communis]|uniref:Uncharacterized protein n=1 Tax=Pyrus ussuriensis x Pyrus communis TaxID=2448454 RepID=A0A5N5HZV5_9ROSA|nr:hypothetical protein D8674_029335 [Pyrus ussuriensis x Pyrus communis]
MWDGTEQSGTRPKKNTQGPCRQLKTAKVTRVTNSRIPIGYDERHRATLTAYCADLLPYVVEVLEGNAREEEEQGEGSKFQEIDVFADVYVQHGNELTEKVNWCFRSPPPNFLRIRQSSMWIPLRMQGFTSSQRRWTRVLVKGQGYIVRVSWHRTSLKYQCLYKPSVPPEYISPVFLYHRPHSLSTPSKHSNQAHRPPTPSLTSNKITKHLDVKINLTHKLNPLFVKL